MMSIETLRTAAKLVRALDSVREWIESFEVDEDKDKHPFICFRQIASSDNDGSSDHQSSSGWEGDLTLPRDLAISMLQSAERDLEQRLAALGVDV